jgi:hypothetical protein
MVTEMFRKHAALTEPDLQKLRAPLHEPLVAIADLMEKHITSFQLASMKLSETGHGEDAYRYFEWLKETIKGFPLIATTMVGYYALQPPGRPAEHRHLVRLPGSAVYSFS